MTASQQKRPAKTFPIVFLFIHQIGKLKNCPSCQRWGVYK